MRPSRWKRFEDVAKHRVSLDHQAVEYGNTIVGNAFHEPFIRKRQRAAALQDASEAHVLPGFREVLDCASPLAL